MGETAREISEISKPREDALNPDLQRELQRMIAESGKSLRGDMRRDAENISKTQSEKTINKAFEGV
jgi:hypothetical protein